MARLVLECLLPGRAGRHFTIRVGIGHAEVQPDVGQRRVQIQDGPVPADGRFGVAALHHQQSQVALQEEIPGLQRSLHFVGFDGPVELAGLAKQR